MNSCMGNVKSMSCHSHHMGIHEGKRENNQIHGYHEIHIGKKGKGFLMFFTRHEMRNVLLYKPVAQPLWKSRSSGKKSVID